MPKQRIEALTGIRALAAFLVFFSHFPIYSHTVSKFLQGVLAQGYIGVTIFYVLSGFLITYTYQHQMELNLKNYGRYLWRRFSRIYPVYLLALVITTILIFWFGDFTQKLQGTTNIFAWTILQLTLLKGYFSYTVFSGVSQAWSLTVEFTFYLLAPILLIALRNKLKYFIVPIIYLIGIELLAIGLHTDVLGFMGNLKFVALYTFFGRCFEFIIGALFAISLINESTIYIDKLPFKTYIGFFGIIAIQVILYLIQGNYPFGLYTPLGMMINNWILPIFVLLTIIGFVHEDSLLKRFFGCTLMKLLGQTSYTFYLFQFIVMSYIVSDFNFHIADPRSIWVVLAGFILLNLISIGIYYIYEYPIHQRLNKMVKKP